MYMYNNMNAHGQNATNNNGIHSLMDLCINTNTIPIPMVLIQRSMTHCTVDEHYVTEQTAQNAFNGKLTNLRLRLQCANWPDATGCPSLHPIPSIQHAKLCGTF